MYLLVCCSFSPFFCPMMLLLTSSTRWQEQAKANCGCCYYYCQSHWWDFLHILYAICCKPQFLSSCAQAIPSRVLFVMLKGFCRICISISPTYHSCTALKKAQRNILNVCVLHMYVYYINGNPIFVRAAFYIYLLRSKSDLVIYILFVRHFYIENKNYMPTTTKNIKTENTVQFINISSIGGGVLSAKVCLLLMKVHTLSVNRNDVNVSSANDFVRNMPIKHWCVGLA